MDRVKKILPVLIYAAGLALVLYPFYKNGSIISGGEGAYFIDFLTLFVNRGYSWMDYGAGIVTFSLNFAFIPHLLLTQFIFQSNRIVNFINIFLIYFLPFVAIYGIARQVKISSWLAFLLGLFYVTNPFTNNFLKSINQWNMLAAFIMPAFFWLILRFYRNNFILFLAFGGFSTYFAFTNSNPPTMVMYQIAILVSVLFIHLYFERKFKIAVFLRKYSVVLSSFVLFNFWWIINWLHAFTSARTLYSTGEALTWLRGSGGFIPVMWQALSLTSLTPDRQFASPVLLSIPFLILVIAYFRRDKLKNHLLLLLGTIFAVAFLSKGISPPLGKIYELMVIYIPLFNIFKSAGEKWGVFLVFLVSIFFIFFLKIQKKGISIVTSVLLMVYVGYSLTPLITGQFIADDKHDDIITSSRRYYEKPEYRNIRQLLNNDPREYRILSLPGGYNYQVALKMDNGKYYTGNDPLLNNTNKQFFAPYVVPLGNHIQFFFDNISDPEYFRALPYFNIKKIITNRDEYPWFKFRPQEGLTEIESLLGTFDSTISGPINLYDIGQIYLPRLYIPIRAIKTNKPYEEITKAIKEVDPPLRSVFLQSEPDLPETINLPQITLVKINPSKYKIRVEKATLPYYLVFSTNFHPGWKAYLKPLDDQIDYSNVVDHNFDGQIREASVPFSFIRKDFLQTLPLTPIPEDRHLIANWYANAWYIKPEDAGGAKDYEIIIEYWPQRLFFLGAGVSLATLGVSIFIVIKKRK